MNMRLLLCIAALALSPGPSMAQNAYQRALAELDLQALAFIQDESHASVDPQALTGGQYYSTGNFPGTRDGQGAMGLPDAGLDAITRSILLLEAREAQLAHVRYRVAYSMNASADVPEAQHAYVEVTRYNLGPALRDELMRSVPDGQVADEAQFGVGPHVSWRFALAPIMGIEWGLVHASRKDVSAAQAGSASCLGEPCLALIDPSGPDAGWRPIPPPQLDQAPYVARSTLGVARPARVLQELWASIAADGMDAAVAEIWTRRHEVAEVPVEFSRLYVPRR